MFHPKRTLSAGLLCESTTLLVDGNYFSNKKLKANTPTKNKI